MNTLSAKGAQFMRLHEGFVSSWYLDPVGIPTIGIGFTWRSSAFRKWWGRNKKGVAFARGAKMTRAEAEDALRYLVKEEYGQSVQEFLGAKVAQNVYDAAVSVVYNLGAGSLKWRWAQVMKSGDYRGSAKLLRNTGTTAQGVKLAGLVRRRKEEALLLSDGIYTGVDTPHAPSKAPAMADGVLMRGERGPEVGKLLRDLSRLGFYDGALDDVFGHGAEAAVLAFQEANSLTRDGKAGPQTLAAIKDAAPATIPETAQETAQEAPKGLLALILSLFGVK